jgi:hypothetical protein
MRRLRAQSNNTLPAWLRWTALPAMQVDTLIMRAVDIMLCFPSFFLILTVVALLPPSIYNIMVIIGLTSWMGTTRFVRAEFLSLREQDFVAAPKCVGHQRRPHHISPHHAQCRRRRFWSPPPWALPRPCSPKPG